MLSLDLPQNMSIEPWISPLVRLFVWDGFLQIWAFTYLSPVADVCGAQGVPGHCSALDKSGSFFGRTSITKSSVGESIKRPCSNDLSFEVSSKRPYPSNQSFPSVSNVNPQPTTTPITNVELKDLPKDPGDTSSLTLKAAIDVSGKRTRLRWGKQYAWCI
ncbi:unnamed protein product [Lactuca saligna]|uniref:Uncharacterized protein n=1 Tax=Lactuca saligna TaxID=75948 RepID=A0AA36E0Z9_LACSI|nr:unnamed protein product [Lactuca saligna]